VERSKIRRESYWYYERNNKTLVCLNKQPVATLYGEINYSPDTSNSSVGSAKLQRIHYQENGGESVGIFEMRLHFQHQVDIKAMYPRPLPPLVFRAPVLQQYQRTKRAFRVRCGILQPPRPERPRHGRENVATT